MIPPLQLVPDLPPPLNAALISALAMDALQRPQTMEQFEEWLHEISKSPKVTPMQCDVSVNSETNDKIECNSVALKTEAFSKSQLLIKNKLRDTKNLAFISLIFLSSLITIYQITLILHQNKIGEHLIITWSIIFSALISIWTSLDAQDNKKGSSRVLVESNVGCIT